MKPLPTNVVLIGLHGPMGSGKDTLTDMLIAKLRTSYILKFKCASALYKMAEAFDPAFNPSMSQQAKKDWVLGDEELGTRRNFLEALGTEFGRHCINKEIWLKKLHHDISTEAENAGSEILVAVVTDVRFPNEADFIRANGALIHLVPHWDTGSTSNHVSAEPLPIGKDDWGINLLEGQQEKGLEALTGITLHLVEKACLLAP